MVQFVEEALGSDELCTLNCLLSLLLLMLLMQTARFVVLFPLRRLCCCVVRLLPDACCATHCLFAGPSGVGKSSLLAVLADRLRSSATTTTATAETPSLSRSLPVLFASATALLAHARAADTTSAPASELAAVQQQSALQREFARARAASPCVLVLDDLDVIVYD